MAATTRTPPEEARSVAAGGYESERRTLDLARLADPRNAKLLWRLVKLCASNRKAGDALNYLDAVLALEPGSKKARELSERLRQRMNSSAAKLPSTAAIANAALKAKELQRRQALATAIEAESNGRHGAALDVLREALQLFPEDIQILYRLAAVASRRGFHAEAITAINRLLSVSPDYQKAATLRRVLIAKHGAERAQQASAALAAWDIPRAEECADALADGLEKLLIGCETAHLRGDSEGARHAIEGALEKLPFDVQAYRLAAQILGGEEAAALVVRLRAKPLESLSDQEALALIQILFLDGRPLECLAAIGAARLSHARPPALRSQIEPWELRCLHLLGENERVLQRTDQARATKTLSRQAAAIRARALLDLGRASEARDDFLHAQKGTAPSAFTAIGFHIALQTAGPSAAYASYATCPSAIALSAALPETFSAAPPSDPERGVPCFFIVDGGVGDEIRHAAIYPALSSAYPGATVTCDPRLQKILERSFPGLRFRPVARWREETRFGKYAERSEVGGNMNCAQILDNAAWAAARKSPIVSLVVSSVSRLFPDNGSFLAPRAPHLKADPGRVEAFRTFLAPLRAKGKRLVGICWRSTLRDAARDVHYTSISQWAEIFSIEDIALVNLQPRCAPEERQQAHSFERGIVDVPQLDLFDDLEGCAALMQALDVVVAPATTTIELAGAVGAKSLLLAPGFETAWRKTGDGRDAWHASVEVIVPPRLGDKAAMLSALAQRLRRP